MIEYFNAEGLNSTLLGSFAQDPAYAVQKFGKKIYFEHGHAFEDLFQQTVEKSTLFDDKYFVSDVKVPESLMDCWTSRKEKRREKLESSYVYNKPKKLTKKQIESGEISKPELSGTKKSLHECLDAVLENDCKFPIATVDFEAMKLGVERLLQMDVEIYDNTFNFGELMQEKVTFQYSIYWEHNDIKKKALVDILVEVDGMFLHFDLKYVANLAAFEKSFRRTNDRYVIQSMHYSEGMTYEFGGQNTVDQMVFIVGTKSEPYLVRPYLIDESSIEYCQMFYDELCMKCDSWIDQGKPISGIKQTKYNRIWGN